MLGLGSIKERIATIGEGLKSQFSGEVEYDEVCVNLRAGSKILSHYQLAWKALHDNAEQVARKAETADREVRRVEAEYDKQWRHVSRMTGLVVTIPEINTQIQGVMDSLGQLESVQVGQRKEARLEYNLPDDFLLKSVSMTTGI